MGPLASVPAEAIAWVARTVLGVTFLGSGAAKLQDGPAFTLAVADYRILPSPLARPVAHVVPLAELGVAVALLSGWYMRQAAFTSILLLLVFALAVGVNIHRGQSVACFCFGASSDDTIGWPTLVRQALLLGLALPPLVISRPAVGLVPAGISTGDAASLLGAAAATTVIVASVGLVPQLNRLAEQHKAPPIVVIVGPGQGVDYAGRLSREIRLVHDPKRKIQADYEVRWKPTVYLIDAEQKVALHTISNTLPGFEDTVDGIGHRLSSDSTLPKDEGSGDDG